MYWNDGHMDDGWGIAMMLGVLGILLVLVATLVFAIVWSVRTSAPSQGVAAMPPRNVTSSLTGSAAQILAERLARGEIDVEEYRTRLEALTSSRAHVVREP